jgi:hypothetical protein
MNGFHMSILYVSESILLVLSSNILSFSTCFGPSPFSAPLVQFQLIYVGRHEGCGGVVTNKDTHRYRRTAKAQNIEVNS